MSYYDDEQRSHSGLYILLAVIFLCLLSFGIFSFFLKKHPPATSSPQGTDQDFPVYSSSKIESSVEVAPETVEAKKAKITPEPLVILKTKKPENLLKQIAASLGAGQLEEALHLIGEDKTNPEDLARLRQLQAAGKIQINENNTITEIGELDHQKLRRFSLNLKDGQAPIYFDLARNPQTGTWSVEKFHIPSGDLTDPPLHDPLGIVDAFIRAALEQDFQQAKSLVQSPGVSDAKIAGLCIIFEEAKYQLRAQKPLRAMFQKDLVSGFKAYVETADGQSTVTFGINAQRKSQNDPWKITEINLDSILEDYAQRIAGGDVHFTPMIKNPTGGDTLIIYFGFDAEELAPRTKRQLDIVASILKTDLRKKLTVSGHTDAMGSNSYNAQLSQRRAIAVQNYLFSIGVPKAQLHKTAEGESQPRLPNTTQTGEDNPSGRRANRRTEIYLDF